MTSPPLDSITLADTSSKKISTAFTNDTTIYVFTHPRSLETDSCKILVSEDSTLTLDDSTTIFKDYTWPHLFKITSKKDTHWVYSSVRDEVGNWSDTLFASIIYDPDIKLQDMILEDPDSSDSIDVCTRADTLWTNDTCVKVTIIYKGSPLQILISEDAAPKNWVSYNSTEWKIINDSTIEITHCFISYDQEQKWLWGRLVGPNITDSSNVDSGFINIDTIPPATADSLSLYSVFSTSMGMDTSYTYMKSTEVRTFVYTALDSLSKLKLNDVCYDNLDNRYDASRGRFDITYNIRNFAEDGPKEISCTVRDSAGNWSGEISDTIILDRKPPNIAKFVISDPSTDGTSDSIYCNDDSVEVTAVFHDNSPGQLYLIELFQLDPNSIPQNVKAWKLKGNDTDLTVYYKYEQSLLIEDTLLTVYCLIYDAAGNPSDTLFDSIAIVLPPKISMTLYDTNDREDSLFSRSDCVGVKINHLQGLIDSVSISFYSLDCKFAPWTSGQSILDTTFCFCLADTSAEVILYCKANNNLGDFDSVSASIIIDLQNPTVSKQSLYLWCPKSGDSLWANDTEIQVHFEACDNKPGELAKIIVAESADLSANRKEFPIESYQENCANTKILYQLSPQQGVK